MAHLEVKWNVTKELGTCRQRANATTSFEQEMVLYIHDILSATNFSIFASMEIWYFYGFKWNPPACYVKNSGLLFFLSFFFISFFSLHFCSLTQWKIQHWFNINSSSSDIHLAVHTHWVCVWRDDVNWYLLMALPTTSNKHVYCVCSPFSNIYLFSSIWSARKSYLVFLSVNCLHCIRWQRLAFPTAARLFRVGITI